jgi:predicted small metal-binding protein
MKQFQCGDVVAGCNASFWAETEDGILPMVGAYALGDHGVTGTTEDLVAAAAAGADANRAPA